MKSKIELNLFNKQNVLIFSFFIILSTESWGQYNEFFLPEFFFGRQPSAKAEAMGRGYTFIDTDLASIFYNPAGITTIKGIEIIASHSAPFYLLSDAKFEFISMGYRHNEYLSIGLSRNHFSTGVDTIIDWSGRFIGTFTPYATIHSFTCSSQPLKNLSLGLNTNIFTWHPFNRSVIAYYFDFGLIKEFKLPHYNSAHNKFYFSTSISNFNFVKAPPVANFISEENELPVISRYGLNYYQYYVDKNLISDTLNTYRIVLSGEYQWVINSKYHSGIHSGSELMFLEILSLRCGYYSEKTNDYGLPEYNKNRVSSFTYGAGVQIPFSKLTKVPINFNFDYISMPPPNYTKIHQDFDNFTTYTFRINWIFRK